MQGITLGALTVALIFGVSIGNGVPTRTGSWSEGVAFAKKPVVARRHAVRGQGESLEDELCRVEHEFEDARSMRHPFRRIAEVLDEPSAELLREPQEELRKARVLAAFGSRVVVFASGTAE